MTGCHAAGKNARLAEHDDKCSDMERRALCVYVCTCCRGQQLQQSFITWTDVWGAACVVLGGECDSCSGSAVVVHGSGGANDAADGNDDGLTLCVCVNESLVSPTSSSR